jgi:hypothetical protein
VRKSQHCVPLLLLVLPHVTQHFLDWVMQEALLHAGEAATQLHLQQQQQQKQQQKQKQVPTVLQPFDAADSAAAGSGGQLATEAHSM